MEILLLIPEYYICLVVHELGHLLLALLLLDEPVNLSFGQRSINKNNSFSFKTGKLTIDIYLSSLIFNPSGSFSVNEKNYSLWKTFLITLGGPLFSLLFYYYLYLYNFSISFSVISLMVFLISLVPMSDKDNNFSDGYQLVQIIRYKMFKYSPVVFYEKLSAFSNSKQYQKGIEYYLEEIKGNENRFSKMWKSRFSYLLDDMSYQVKIKH